jgi:molybdopterin/thiamine biosynthesis adenylyltransferase
MAQEDRYSRQIYSIGEDVSKKIGNSTILLFNYSDLTQEIAKNLILMGFNVDINPTNTTNNGVYYENITDLNHLNPLVNVNMIKIDNVLKYNYTKYKLVILTNSNISYATGINNTLRLQKIPFILTGCYGLMGYIFNDLLNEYTFDKPINNNKLYIENINENNIIFKDDHHFFKNNIINILNTKTNENIVAKITKIINSKNIIIENSFNFNFNNEIINFNDYVVTSKQLRETFNYKSLGQSFEITPENTVIYGYDFKKAKKLHELHLKLDGTQIDTISPISSIIGGICAHEVLKIVGNKNIPIKQWFYIDFFELSESKDNHIIDQNLLNKVKDITSFVVGSGAIGCELLKHLALLDSKIIVTDMDSIEKSNLSRQFLFDDNDVGKSKSEVASNKIKKINKNVDVKSYNLKLCPENNNIFHDDFHNNIDIYMNALDNVDARAYTNELAIKYSKPLIDSGTLGSLGSTQVVIPNLTNGYVSQKSKNENIPICTIKSFPYKQEHTIQWGRELFEQEFNILPIIIKKNKNKINLNNLIDDEINTLSCQIYKYNNFELNEKTFTKILSYIYYDNFEISLEEIYKTYTQEKLADKVLPKKLDKNDDNIKEYIHNYLDYGFTILNQLFNSNVVKSDKLCSQYLLIEIDENYIEIIDNIENKHEFVNKIINNSKFIADEIEFEKDDDLLKHTHWITTVANLRNIQYSIATATVLNTRKIAGNIIPAIITTTSIVSGFQILEFLKIVKYSINTNYINNENSKDIELYKNIFIDLNISYFQYAEPEYAEKDELNMTIWDNFFVDTNDVQEIINIIETKYKKHVDIITNGINNDVIYDGDDIEEKTIKVNDNTCVLVNDSDIIKKIFYKN